MRCDECKHWELLKNDWEAENIGFGQCLAVLERWEIQDKASEGLEWGEGGSEYVRRRADALREARAYVQDGSQYIAELITGPDFFCALFEPR